MSNTDEKNGRRSDGFCAHPIQGLMRRRIDAIVRGVPAVWFSYAWSAKLVILLEHKGYLDKAVMSIQNFFAYTTTEGEKKRAIRHVTWSASSKMEDGMVTGYYTGMVYCNGSATCEHIWGIFFTSRTGIQEVYFTKFNSRSSCIIDCHDSIS